MALWSAAAAGRRRFRPLRGRDRAPASGRGARWRFGDARAFRTRVRPDCTVSLYMGKCVCWAVVSKRVKYALGLEADWYSQDNLFRFVG